MDKPKYELVQLKKEYFISTFIALVIILLLLSGDFNLTKTILTVIISWAIIVTYIYLDEDDEDKLESKEAYENILKGDDDHFYFLAKNQSLEYDDILEDDELL